MKNTYISNACSHETRSENSDRPIYINKYIKHTQTILSSLQITLKVNSNNLLCILFGLAESVFLALRLLKVQHDQGKKHTKTYILNEQNFGKTRKQLEDLFVL